MPNDPLAAVARERVREIVRRDRAGWAPEQGPVLSHEVWAKVAEDVSAMQTGWLVRDVEFASNRRRLGPVVVRTKRMLLRLLHPFPQRQSEYNLAVNRILTHLLELTYRQAETIEELEARLDELTPEADERR